MIKLLLKLLIVVVILLILIPLGLLLFGEGALAYKIFDWSCTNGGGSDYTMPSFNGNGRTITIENDGETYNITDDAFVQGRYTLGLTKAFKTFEGKNGNAQIAIGYRF